MPVPSHMATMKDYNFGKDGDQELLDMDVSDSEFEKLNLDKEADDEITDELDLGL